MTEKVPHIALVGRPNVGKSTLFNRLIHQRLAIVADIAGTTRDRLHHQMEWKGKPFILTDMAGLEVTLAHDTEITQGTQAQVNRALQEAQAIIWVVDGATGATAEDSRIAVLLRDLGKPIMVVVNKCDNAKLALNQYEFSGYGFSEIVPVSALHAKGIEHLLDTLITFLPEEKVVAEVIEDKELRLSIVGRPNVGKSTLLNALSEDQRSVVSAEPGTTRDSVDTVLSAERIFHNTFTKWQTVRIIDTAGIRRSGKIGYSIEGWSVIRTLDAVDRSEVALFMIDATEGMVHQDLQVAQEIVKAGRAVVLLINKWDAVLAKKDLQPDTLEDQREQEKFLDILRQQAPFLFWIQVLFLSAEAGINLEAVGKVVLRAYQAWDLKVEPEQLKELVTEMRKLSNFKSLLNITYEHARPPVFHIHVEGRGLPHFSANRQMENMLRDYLDIGPTLIKIWNVPSVKRNHR